MVGYRRLMLRAFIWLAFALNKLKANGLVMNFAPVLLQRREPDGCQKRCVRQWVSRLLKDFLSCSQVVTNGLKFPSFILENNRLTRSSQRNSLKGALVLPLHGFCLPCLCGRVGPRRAPRRAGVSVPVKTWVPCAPLKCQPASAGCRRLQKGPVITACLQVVL